VLKRILVVAGGLTLAVSLPIVALAVTTEQTPALDNSAVEVSVEVPQPMVQQGLRVHAETGPPEGFVPVRQQLHQPDAVDSGDQNMVRRQQADATGAGRQNMVGRQHTEGNTSGPMTGKSSSPARPGLSEQPRGEVDAPNSGCTGECPNDGEPSRAANRGPGGVGAYGQGGRGNG
jgi:hypothetical protein